jgi:hypothetical protein
MMAEHARCARCRVVVPGKEYAAVQGTLLCDECQKLYSSIFFRAEYEEGVYAVGLRDGTVWYFKKVDCYDYDWICIVPITELMPQTLSVPRHQIQRVDINLRDVVWVAEYDEVG